MESISLYFNSYSFFSVGISQADLRHSASFGKGRDNAILAGGGIGGDDVEIFSEIARRAGGNNGNICIIVASSYPWTWGYEDCLADGLTEEAVACADEYGWLYGNSKINIDYYGQILEKHGIGKYTGIYVDPTIREENSNPLLVEGAKSCTGYSFSTNASYQVTLQKDRRTNAAIQKGNVSIVNVKMTVETVE